SNGVAGADVIRRILSRPLGVRLRREVDRAAPADIVEMSVKEVAGGPATTVAQHDKEFIVGAELAGSAEFAERILERDAMHIDAAVLAGTSAARQTPLVDQPGHEIDCPVF